MHPLQADHDQAFLDGFEPAFRRDLGRPRDAHARGDLFQLKILLQGGNAAAPGVIGRDHVELQPMRGFPGRDRLMHGAAIRNTAAFRTDPADRVRQFTGDRLRYTHAKAAGHRHLRAREQGPELIAAGTDHSGGAYFHDQLAV